ncbi:MAG: dihydropteroate synthase [Spirochaetales bacterium]|nr:dihydropteroate synthase [Spirochaetales bacterium]
MLSPSIRIMAIANLTPDSFYASSRTDAVDRVLKMVEEGADIIDIGGESSRPGAEYVSEEEEKRRVIPFIRELRRETDIPLSVDTRKSGVAREALDLGVQMINDISALEDDRDMARVIASYGAETVLMHKKGLPVNMQNNPSYDDVTGEVCRYLEEAVRRAEEGGISREKIIVDPGIGFGKRQEDNRRLLRDIPRLKELGCPVLIGLSRKSYIGNILNVPPEERLYGTLAADMFAAGRGADILRVHDVKPHREMLDVLGDLEWTG